MSIDSASPQEWDNARKRQVGVDWCEANVVKYITRWRDKNGLEDLRKAMHYIQLLIDREVQS
jgi:hypothetical protein